MVVMVVWWCGCVINGVIGSIGYLVGVFTRVIH